MNQMSLADYLNLSNREPNKTPKKQDDFRPLWWYGCSWKPQINFFKISCVNHTAMVLYYIELDFKTENFIYHYTVLYEDMHYEQDVYYDDSNKITFEQYINETVKCKLCEMYVNRVPIFREAVIFNHI